MTHNKMPASGDCLFINATLVDAHGVHKGSVLVRGGKIAAIQAPLASGDARDCPPDTPIYNVKGAVLMPAFVDLHTHFRTPGFTHKEDVESGSRAAVRGGYTVVNCMANTKPVCSSAAIALEVMAEAARIGLCEVNQCVSITKDFDGKTLSHLEELPPQLRMISDDGRGVQSAHTMWHAMQTAAARGLTVLSHAEDMEMSAEDYRLAENLETARNLILAEATGARLHLCHVSTREAVDYVRQTKKHGKNPSVTCEVTPHHLYFATDTPKAGEGQRTERGAVDGSQYRVNPPIRTQDDRRALLAAIEDGTVDAIATDHAPHTPEDKANGAPGFVGLETAFAVCNTVLCCDGGLSLSTLSALMSYNPASILGLGNRKGLLKKGYDADFVLLRGDLPITIHAKDFAGKSRNTPYEGITFYGRIEATVKAGCVVYEAETLAETL